MTTTRKPASRWDVLKDAILQKAVSEIEKFDVSALLAMEGPKNEGAVDAVFEDHPAKVPRKRRKAPPSLPAPEPPVDPQK